MVYFLRGARLSFTSFSCDPFTRPLRHMSIHMIERMHEIQLSEDSIDLLMGHPQTLLENIINVLRYGAEEMQDPNSLMFMRVPLVPLGD